MSEAKKLEAIGGQTNAVKINSTKEKIENTYTEELILGICSPIGSLRSTVIDGLKNRLEKEYNYEVTIIKLSDFISEHYDKNISSIKDKTKEFATLMHKIDGGRQLRNKFNNKSILVELAIKKIREDRKEAKTISIKGKRKCYIIDSLKNQEELNVLRAVYRDIFYLFSVFTSEEEQEKYLLEKGLSKPEVSEIVKTDEFENDFFGQDVRNTFISGDFFIRLSNEEKVKDNITKYLHLIFNSEIITPNVHETAMFHAKSSAGNSACLSRQVGASITSQEGIVIAKGWNDVPKYGGNLYNDTELKSFRCKELGYCSNVKQRNEIIEEIKIELKKIAKGNQLQLVNEGEDVGIENVIKIIEKSRFKNVIEYSRSIHAEMHAIIIGSQLTGNKMIGGSLYCTTYPCHNCARHIVVAGIKNIYYIEPYKKSLCITLHSDALTENENETDKVKILPFDGVAPRRYLDFFSMNSERKNSTGILIKKDFSKIAPKKRLSLQAIPELENQAILSLEDCGLIKKV